MFFVRQIFVRVVLCSSFLQSNIILLTSIVCSFRFLECAFSFLIFKTQHQLPFAASVSKDVTNFPTKFSFQLSVLLLCVCLVLWIVESNVREIFLIKKQRLFFTYNPRTYADSVVLHLVSKALCFFFLLNICPAFEKKNKMVLESQQPILYQISYTDELFCVLYFFDDKFNRQQRRIQLIRITVVFEGKLTVDFKCNKWLFRSNGVFLDIG